MVFAFVVFAFVVAIVDIQECGSLAACSVGSEDGNRWEKNLRESNKVAQARCGILNRNSTCQYTQKLSFPQAGHKQKNV